MGLRSGVTIGIPVYNEARFVEATTRSAVEQCEFGVISDNASTDGSAEICERLVREYPHLSLLRQERNLGASSNFWIVLEKASTPYFMWLGGHDALPAGHVETLRRMLESNCDAVMAYGPTRYVDLDDQWISDYDYDYSSLLSDRSPSVRTLGLIRHLSDCSLVHGLFRTEALRSAWTALGDQSYLGLDHVLLSHAAVKGRFLYDRGTHFIRREMHPDGNATKQLERITGYAPKDDQHPRRKMQRGQYLVAADISKRMGVSGPFFRLRARYHLVSRFGPFGETFGTRTLDRLLWRQPIRASMNQLDKVLGRFDR